MDPAQLFRALDAFVAAPAADLGAARQIGAAWETSFPRLSLPRTLTGTKALKEDAKSLLWFLKYGDSFESIQSRWEDIRPQWAKLLAAYGQAGAQAPAELVLGGVTYKDGVGMAASKLQGLAKRFDALWDLVQGWRRKALKPGMTVLFAGPKEFGGTASGKYRAQGDLMLVRATPKIFARPSREYAGLDYILLHELGHRYEHFFPLPTDFDQAMWHTTKYSQADSMAGSEAFAELFALGILDIRGTWGDVLDRFELVMEGRPMLARIIRAGRVRR